jgi:hypothetical protein
MKAFVLAASLAMAFVSSSARAEDLSFRRYPTPQSAALHGAALKIQRASSWGTTRAKDVRIARTIDGKAPTFRYKVVTRQTQMYSKTPLVTQIVTVKKVAPGSYRFTQ